MFGDYRIGNRRITATITKPRQSISGFLTPVKALIHVSKNYRLMNGDILAEGNTPLYILAYHHATSVANVFTGVEVNCQIELTQSTVSTNPVTKMKENRVIGIPRKIYACEALITAEEVAGLKSPEKIYYLPVKVTSDHFINGVRVRNCSQVSGIYRVEVG